MNPAPQRSSTPNSPTEFPKLQLYSIPFGYTPCRIPGFVKQRWHHLTAGFPSGMVLANPPQQPCQALPRMLAAPVRGATVFWNM